MKYNLSKPLIKEMVGRPDIWLLGYDIFRNQKVHILEGLNQLNLRALVYGDRPHDISLTFSKLGELLHFRCSCQSTQSLCEHCTAVLLQLTEKGELLKRIDQEELPWPFNDHTILEANKNVELIKESDSKEAYEDAMMVVTDVKATKMLEPFSHVKMRFDMVPIKLEGFVEWLDDEKYPVCFSLKIGLTHLYNVKDVPALMNTFLTGDVIHYGKNFTLDPQKHCIDTRDVPIFEFVQDLMGEQTLLSQGENHKQKLHITAYRFRQLIDLVLAYQITLYEKESGEPLLIKEGLPKIVFDIEKKDNQLHTNTNLLEAFTFVGNEGFFLRSNSRHLYKIPYRLQNIFMHLKKLADQDMFVPVPTHMMQDYIDIMYPIFKRIGEARIEASLAEDVISETPEHRLYIDYKEKAIVIKPITIYGKLKFNLLNDTVEGNSRGKLCIRDFKSEHEFMSHFDNEIYLTVGDTLRIILDQHIYHFLIDDLKELSKIAKVYSTKRFKQKRILEPTQLTQHVKISENLDYVSFTASLEGISQEEFKRILKAYREKKNYYLLKNGAYISLENLNLELIDQTISHFGIKQSALGKPVHLPISSAFYLKDLVTADAKQTLEDYIHKVQHTEDASLHLPSPLMKMLRPYQVRGIKWLVTHSKLNLGGILADDMGLGKTVQILSYLMQQKHEMEGKHTLIIAPTSLIYNWGHEIEKFTKGLSYAIIAGTQEERVKRIEKNHAMIWITSYGSLRRDIAHYESMRFYSVILDEAQHIKNEGSLGAKHVKRLQADHRFAVTGTPIENHLGEMWSIFDFILPKHLGTRHYFKQHFEKTIIIEKDPVARDTLQKLISPFILRRVKEDVLKELPEKIESQVFVGMTHEQRNLYLATIAQLRGTFETEKTPNRIKMLAGLTRLRQICSHPSSYLEDYDGGSGKLDAFLETLEELRDSGHRVLVFSQFTSVLRILKNEVNIKYFYMDGKTGAEERLKLVERFNSGERDVFFISLKAGGTGLNLIGADTVIHYDPWWNPAVEEQASDRAHRIGQTKKVHVIRFVTEDSIEEKIQELKNRKRDLIDTFVQPGETWLQNLSESDLYELFFDQ